MAEDNVSPLYRCRCGPCKSSKANRSLPIWSDDLLKLVDYESTNGKALTLLKYNPANFALLGGLNHNILSIHGVVDVDWMFRIAIVSADVRNARGSYLVSKTVWNTLRGVLTTATGDGMFEWEYGTILETANRNAPEVANAWLKPGVTLEQIFAPTLSALRARS